jgi:hypothetical protein
VVSVLEIMSRFKMNGRTQQPPLTNMNLLQTYKLKDILATSVPSLVYIPPNTCFTPLRAQWATYRRCNIDKLAVVFPKKSIFTG